MKTFYQVSIVILLCIASLAPSSAFVTQPRSGQITPAIQQRQSPPFSVVILKAEEDEKVEVGSKEYLEGFISSPIQDESVAERGSGLEQALKLGGYFTVGLGVLFLGFMASNGLL